ncbi:MAG: uncharacterized protein A8A55_2687 [Amphiamblys sp. WSBS2006]|nr:MAG: uncharacterized protein A8A55_2687 [Amphiamblys sp. WSBS2006]
MPLCEAVLFSTSSADSKPSFLFLLSLLKLPFVLPLFLLDFSVLLLLLKRDGRLLLLFEPELFQLLCHELLPPPKIPNASPLCAEVHVDHLGQLGDVPLFCYLVYFAVHIPCACSPKKYSAMSWPISAQPPRPSTETQKTGCCPQ